jgi:hypothetical protein
MEPTMPDLKSALQSVLNEWNQPEQTVQTQHKPNLPPFFTRTTDVTRETFNYVRDNPHRTTRQIRDALVAKGHKDSSVSALVSQMSRTGIITRAPNGTYFTNLQEYSPVKLSKLRKARNTPTPTGRNPKADKPKVVLTRKEVPAAPAPVASAPRVVNSIDELISTLTIAQAKELFDKLRKMFA